METQLYWDYVVSKGKGNEKVRVQNPGLPGVLRKQGAKTAWAPRGCLTYSYPQKHEEIHINSKKDQTSMSKNKKQTEQFENTEILENVAHTAVFKPDNSKAGHTTFWKRVIEAKTAGFHFFVGVLLPELEEANKYVKLRQVLQPRTPTAGCWKLESARKL